MNIRYGLQIVLLVIFCSCPFEVFAGELEKLERAIQSTIEGLRLRRHSIESEYNDDGEVKLSGYVSSQEDKDLVVKNISSIPGVSKVEDLLTVKAVANSPEVKDANGAAVTGEPPLDPQERVRKQALLAIKKLATLKSYEVDVHVSESTVVILGSATEEADIKKITKAVRDVSGARAVNNTMTIRPRPADAELESAIKRALSDEANLDWEGITVHVVNGIAYFEGTKSNHREIDRILSIANMVDGVARVESKMKVSR